MVELEMFMPSNVFFSNLYLYMPSQDFSPEEDTAEEDDGDIESDASESLSYVSVIHDQTSHTVEKDLLMVTF